MNSNVQDRRWKIYVCLTLKHNVINALMMAEHWWYKEDNIYHELRMMICEQGRDAYEIYGWFKGLGVTWVGDEIQYNSHASEHWFLTSYVLRNNEISLWSWPKSTSHIKDKRGQQYNQIGLHKGLGGFHPILKNALWWLCVIYFRMCIGSKHLFKQVNCLWFATGCWWSVNEEFCYWDTLWQESNMFLAGEKRDVISLKARSDRWMTWRLSRSCLVKFPEVGANWVKNSRRWELNKTRPVGLKKDSS